MRLLLKISVIFLFISGFSYAQNDSLVNIKGIAKDSTSGLPVQGALVKLQESNNELLKYSETDADGAFSFADVPPGSYEVQLVKEPYTALSTNFIVHSSDVDLGILFMSQNYTTEEIVVETKKPFMEIRDDKKIFNVENNIITQGKTAIDVLKTLPLVTVDGQDNIMLRNDARIKILINGKENRMYSNLRQVPADIIERVELITTPSAKYEAEGVTGIINIILKDTDDDGYTGSISIGGSTLETYNTYGNFNYKKSRTTLYTNLGFGSWANDITGDSRREDFLSNPSVLTSTTNGDNRGNYQWGSLGLEFDINDYSVTGLEFSMNGWNGNNNIDFNQVFSSSTQNYEEFYKNMTHYDGTNMNGSIYYNNKFDTTDRELNLDFSYGRNNWNTDYRQDEIVTPPSAIKDLREQKGNTFTGQLDYTHPFGKFLKMEIGYKGTFNINKNSIQADSLDPNTGEFVNNTSRSQDFDYDSFVNGFYATFSKSFGPLSTKVGLRTEATHTYFNDVAIGNRTRDYIDYFPSASFVYKFGMLNSINLSYSRRVNRPAIWYLNPFVNVYNNQSISTGNPELEPEYTNSIELGLNTSILGIMVNPTVYYRKTDNVITRYSYLTDSNTTVSSYNNSSELNTYGADLIFSGQMYEGANFNATFNISRLTFSGTPGTSLDNEGTAYGVSAYTSLPVGQLVNFDVYFGRWGDRVTAQGTNVGKNYLSVGISKSMMDNKLRVNVNVQDILADVGRPESYTNGIGFTQRYFNNYSQKGVSIHISYSFGNTDPQNKRRKKNSDQPQQPQGDQR